VDRRVHPDRRGHQRHRRRRHDRRCDLRSRPPFRPADPSTTP
jgi:hypothetical protein